MGKSAFQIQMDYNNAIRQADSLAQIARDLQKSANSDFRDCISEISRGWTGNNASSYIRKCTTLQENIIKTAGKLEKTAETIRKIAKNTYNAEIHALEIALIRKY